MSAKHKPLRLAIAQLLCRRFPPFISQKMREAIYSGHYGRTDNYSCAARAQTGSVLEGVTSDYHFQKFCVNGFYDWRNIALCLAVASRGDTIIDVGANIGTETISFADIVGPAGKVHAIEPLPAHVQTLRRANESSRYKNIAVYPYALSSSEGVASFIPPPVHHNGVGHLAWQSSDDSTKAISVSVRTLDSLSTEKRIGPARLIVTDLEGEEVNFLHGARQYIGEHRPYLLMEAAPPLLK